MTLRSWRYAALVVVMGAGLAACGDDDTVRPGVDGGGGGIDAGGGGDTDGGGGGDTDGGGGGDIDGGGARVCSIAGGMCDVIMQNCADPTQGCYVLITEEGSPPTTVCAAAGTGADGTACTTFSDCQPGLTCDQETMLCRRYCCEGRTTDCPSGTGQICVSYSNAMPTGICTAPSGCTVVPQTGCEAGQGCYWISDDFTSDCRSIPAGSVDVGGTCGAGQQCVPGAACFTPSGGGDGTCRQLCRMGMDADCTGGGTCMSAGGLPSGIGACATAG